MAAERVDPVGNEYIRQMKSIVSNYSYNKDSVGTYMEERKFTEVEKGLEKLGSLLERADNLRLDALKYYKGNLPPAFSAEWTKVDNELRDLNKKSARREETAPLVPK